MNDSENIEHSISDLDQIRQVETQVVRKIESARKRAEVTLREARSQADRMMEVALEEGREEGERAYHEIIQKAEVEAKKLIDQAVERAEAFRRAGELRLDAAIRIAYKLVIGTEEEMENT